MSITSYQNDSKKLMMINPYYHNKLLLCLTLTNNDKCRKQLHLI